MIEGYKSEVAYFREQQALRDESAERGLSGFAAVASHESITARMERGAERILRLAQEGKHEEALALMNSDAWYAEAEEVQQEGGEQLENVESQL